MNALAAIMLCLMAAPTTAAVPLVGAPAPPVAPAYPTELLDKAWQGFSETPDFIDMHRGYLAYLAAHPEMAAAEEAYADINSQVRFRALSDAFDDALLADEARRTLYDQLCESLATNEKVRHAMDHAWRVIFEDKTLLRQYPNETLWLLGHPDKVLKLLDHPERGGVTPREFLRLKLHLKVHARLSKNLYEALQILDGDTLAHTHVFPWFAALANESSAVPGGAREGMRGAVREAYQQLLGYFAEYETHFWIWYRRAIALAADPHAAEWIRYWRARVRGSMSLAPVYDDYLKTLRQYPEVKKEAFSTWEKVRGAAPAWPPEGHPPTYIPQRNTAAGKSPVVPPRIEEPRVPLLPHEPERPSVQRPEMPVKPRVFIKKKGTP